MFDLGAQREEVSEPFNVVVVEGHERREHASLRLRGTGDEHYKAKVLRLILSLEVDDEDDVDELADVDRLALLLLPLLAEVGDDRRDLPRQASVTWPTISHLLHLRVFLSAVHASLL